MTDVLRYAVFAETPEGGNPAGVVLDASSLSPAERQRIAAAVGYPETAFLVRDETAARRYAVRYHSPGAEVPFCGHATVGAAVALAEREGSGAFTFDTAVGDVVLTAEDQAEGIVVSFTSVPPTVRELEDAVLDELLGLLSLNRADLEPTLPPREAFAGNAHPVIVLRDRELFHQFRYAPAPVARLMATQGWSGTVTVLHEVTDGDFLARNLFPVARITEDPATGSAAAATGAFLRSLGRVPADGRVRIRQGMHVGRPSVLLVRVPPSGGIVVSGGASRIDN